jgi:hypothetical protein
MAFSAGFAKTAALTGDLQANPEGDAANRGYLPGGKWFKGKV